MTCVTDTYPFAVTDTSEQVQNYGCLPTLHDIVKMRTVYGKTWACHSKPTTPCVGALRYLKKQGLPYNIIDSQLITEADPWYIYC